MSEYLIVSCSLNAKSNSRILCKAAYQSLSAQYDTKLIDLNGLELPLCDGALAYQHPNVVALTEEVKQASCILLGIPIYNYAASASAKNLIELTGHSWTDKVVGFMCAAGGRMSYMSVMNLANSLMLDFRCLIIPRFVYAHGDSFDAAGQYDQEIHDRIEELAATAARLTIAMQK